MNDYIVLDGKRYKTLAGSWKPVRQRPVVVRRLFSGAGNVTFGPLPWPQWEGEIAAPAQAVAPWGTMADLVASYDKQQALAFVDHLGVSRNVVIVTQIEPRHVSPMWDAPSNEAYYPVVLVSV